MFPDGNGRADAAPSGRRDRKSQLVARVGHAAVHIAGGRRKVNAGLVLTVLKHLRVCLCRPRCNANPVQTSAGATPRHMPQGLYHGRPHLPRPHQIVERCEVALFLLGHMAYLVARPAAPDDRQLPVIDPDCAVFAGMIDPDRGGDLGCGDRIAGQIGRTVRVHAVTGACAAGRRVRAKTPKQTAAMPSDATRFQPANATPRSDHYTWSHKTGAVPRIWRFMASSVIAPPELTVQALGPANHCISTPT